MRVYNRKKITKEGTLENNWDWHFEFDYKDFDKDGREISSGSEELTIEQARQLKTYEVRAFDGRTDRAGHKMTEVIGMFRIHENEKPGNAARFLYGDKVARVIRI